MGDNDLDSVVNQLARIGLGGVSFEGKSLKLNTRFDAEEVVKQIEECGDLSYLNMAGNTLGVEAAEAIAQALKKHPEFKRALWKDMFTGRMKEEIPKALKHLGDGLVAAGAQLVELDLSDNAFGPIGVGGLAALLRSQPCYTLQELRLNNNGLGITGGKMLAEGLLQCHKNSLAVGKGLALKIFIAGRNRLENPGAIALAEVFKTLGTLKEVVMPQNGIYHPGVKALSDAFQHNTELEVLNLNDNTLTKRGAAALSETLPLLPKLRILNLGDCLLKTKGSILIAEALTHHTQLEEVILSGNEMCIRGGLVVAQVLKDRPSLKVVDLNDNPLGKKGWSDIKSLLQSVLAVASDEEDDDSDEEEEEEEESDEENEDEEDEDEEVKEEDVDEEVKEEDEDEEVKEEDEDEDEELKEDDDDDDEYEDEEEEEVVDEDDEESGIPTPVRAMSPGNSATTVAQFLESPSAVRLIALSSDGEHVSLLRQYVQTLSDKTFVDQIIPLIMKVSALCVHNHDAAKPIALEASEALYSDLFEWVEKTGQSVLTTVNNALLVHLGLIKSEDKKMKVLWNLDGCLVALNNVLMKKTIIPISTQVLLRFFLERPDSRVQLHEETKRMILHTLAPPKKTS